jgi:hypothetical protein
MSDLIVRIINPGVDGRRKFEQAVEALIKASSRFNADLREGHQEQSPYQAIRDLEEQLLDEVDEGLYDLFSSMSSRWLRSPLQKALPSAEFKLNGRVYINPKTGKPLTKKEWDIISRDVEKALGIVFQNAQELLVYKAMALGKILQSYDIPSSAPPLSSIVLSKLIDDDAMKDAYAFAKQHAAEHIASLKANARKRIATTIIDAQRNRLGPRQLEARLLDQFASLNRDWRMVAQTELITNANNGAILSALNGAKRGKTGEPVLMIGISAPNACSWCASHVRGKVVVVLASPPRRGDQVTISGKRYTAIWPGKSNVGRSKDEWWLSTGAQHPHCRCSWNRFLPEVSRAYR